MANKSGPPAKRSGGAGRGRGAASKGSPPRKSKQPQQPNRPKPKPKPKPPAFVPAEPARTFRLGVVAGATPGKWIDAWNERMPLVSLEVVPLDGADQRANQRAAIDEVDAALIRLPLVDDSLHIIALYDEQPVVVAAIDSHLLIAQELSPTDLTGEVLITPLDDVLGELELPGTVRPAFDAVATTEEAIATAATGTGIVVVPMSLARLHHRKDVDNRVLQGAPCSTVALVWPRERSTADVDTFDGIVRGRTQNSSR